MKGDGVGKKVNHDAEMRYSRVDDASFDGVDVLVEDSKAKGEGDELTNEAHDVYVLPEC